MGKGRDVRAGVEDDHGSLVSRICWAKYDLNPNVLSRPISTVRSGPLG